MNPSSLTTLTEAILAPGAIPTMPTPLRSAPIVPATWVPWSLVVGAHASSPVAGRPASVQPTDLARSIWLTRSGWSGSMPESRTPTVTSGEPVVIVCACGTLIICMSHCSPSRGSVVVAAVPSETSPFLVAGRSWPLPGPHGACTPSGVPSLTATERVGPTDSMALLALAATAVRKSAIVEWATTTPICGQDCTTTPPAAVTACSALRT